MESIDRSWNVLLDIEPDAMLQASFLAYRNQDGFSVMHDRSTVDTVDTVDTVVVSPPVLYTFCIYILLFNMSFNPSSQVLLLFINTSPHSSIPESGTAPHAN